MKFRKGLVQTDKNSGISLAAMMVISALQGFAEPLLNVRLELLSHEQHHLIAPGLHTAVFRESDGYLPTLCVNYDPVGLS